jgi:hypothetical protein
LWPTNNYLRETDSRVDWLLAFNPQDFQAKHVGSYEETLCSVHNAEKVEEASNSLHLVVTLFAMSGAGDQSKEILGAAPDTDSGNFQHHLC